LRNIVELDFDLQVFRTGFSRVSWQANRIIRSPMLLAVVLIAVSTLGAEAIPASVEGSRPVVAGSERLAYGGVGATQTEVVVDVRVYGNHNTPSADILALTGPIAGQPATSSLIRDVRKRLERSGRFAKVDVRKRRLSIEDTREVLLVIVVEEHVDTSAGSLTTGTLDRAASNGTWSPVLDYRDGRYTYGARFNLATPFGPHSRISVPFTWGGDRQARVEVERSFENAPVARLAGGGGFKSTKPSFGDGDTRGDLWARVESAPRSWLRAGGEARVADGSVGIEDRLTTVGADLVLDTRTKQSAEQTSAEQKNGVYAALGFKRLSFDATSVAANEDARGTASASRMTFDGRAFLGMVRMTVLGVRADPAAPDQPMPPLEQNLLNGIPSLRGSDAGSRANDNLAGAAVEMLVPITSPTNLGQMGLKVFADATAVYSGGEALADQQFGRGYGAGVYLDRSTFSMGLDVGWPEQGGGANAQLQVGLQFR
jgi:hypothetical protein